MTTYYTSKYVTIYVVWLFKSSWIIGGGVGGEKDGKEIESVLKVYWNEVVVKRLYWSFIFE